MIGQLPSFPPFFLFIYSPVSTLSISWATDMYLLFRSDNDLFWAVKAISNHCGGKHIFTISQCQSEAKTNKGGVHSHPSFLQSVSGNFSDEIFVSDSASCGYCSTISPPTDGLLPLCTALIFPHLTSRHARELPADSSVCVLKLHE